MWCVEFETPAALLIPIAAPPHPSMPPSKLRNEEAWRDTHAYGWIGTRDGMEADELRPGYVLVRATVCVVVQSKRLHQM